MFLEAIKEVLAHEGYYANHPNDKGGETYQGIARKFHPNWQGWRYVDMEKQRNGGFLPNNHKINDPMLGSHVLSFYKEEFWDRANLEKVKDQNLQQIILDAYVNAGGNGIKTLQNTLNRVFGKKLTVDGASGPNTTNAINSVNAQQLFEAFKQARVDYYRAIAKGSNAVFLRGWLNRIGAFNYKVVGLSVAGIIVLGVAGFFL